MDVGSIKGGAAWPVDTDGAVDAEAGGSARATGKLVDHGGSVLKHVDVTPVYLGSWWQTAAGKKLRAHNDAAMADLVKNKGMTGLWAQYGAGKGTSSPSVAMPTTNPKVLTQAQVEALLKKQVLAGHLDVSNKERVFTFVLPPGCELQDDGGSSSLNGMAGYHGSVKIAGREVYYAAMAYSQRTSAGLNGIDFDGNVGDDLSIAESHEITEAVTDPNVEAAIRSGDDRLLGWYDDVTRWGGRTGKGEIGDIPVINAEVAGDSDLSTVWGRTDGFAFQKEWSNRDGQAELRAEEAGVTRRWASTARPGQCLDRAVPSRPFSTPWTVVSVFLFLGVELFIGTWLGPLVLGKYVSPMFHLQLQMMMHLVSFYLGGVLVGVLSPGVRLKEPAVGAFASVMIVFMISFFMPNWFYRFDLSKVVVGGGIAMLLALMGAWSGEKFMGNVEPHDPAAQSTARGRLRAKLWHEDGIFFTRDRSKLP